MICRIVAEHSPPAGGAAAAAAARRAIFSFVAVGSFY